MVGPIRNVHNALPGFDPKRTFGRKLALYDFQEGVFG
jgi:hypothetical protein